MDLNRKKSYLIIQIIVLFLTFAYALFVFFVTKGKTRKGHLTISLFGLIMPIFIFIQIFNPYLTSSEIQQIGFDR